jgi:hypothetical protein
MAKEKILAAACIVATVLFAAACVAATTVLLAQTG